MAAPTLVSITNAAHDGDMSGRIVLTFDMDIAVGEGEIRLERFGNTIFSENAAGGRHIAISGSTITIDAPGDLTYSSTYRLVVPFYAIKSAKGGEQLASTVEHFFVTGGSPGPLLLTGTAGADKLVGSMHNDTLFGLAGNDELLGGEGNNTLDGGAGDDMLTGGFESDAMYGDAGDDQLYDSNVDAAINLLDGGAGHDRLEVAGGSNTVLGGVGNDVLILRGGNGTLSGGDGDDRITVVLDSRPLDISASGGAGRDTFVVGPVGEGAPTITDFSAGAGGDLLDPFRIYNNASRIYSLPSDAPPAEFLFTTGHLQLEQHGADTLLQFDADGGAGPLAARTIAVLRDTQAAALTADNFTQGQGAASALQGIRQTGADDADTLTGTALNDALGAGGGNDRLQGLDGNDYLDGMHGDDTLAGNNGNDALRGGSGRDTMEGGAGDDMLEGDDGSSQGGFTPRSVDHALFDTVFDNASITRTEPNSFVWQVTDKSGALGTDTLSHIERLAFRDKLWALDVGVGGNAGDVYRLYQAAFDRTPDMPGLAYWLKQADDGMTMGDVSASFIRSDEFRALYGDNPTSAEIVTRLYSNILDRVPEAEGKSYWIDMLDRKLVTVADALYLFASSPENVRNVAKIIGGGFEYTA